MPAWNAARGVAGDAAGDADLLELHVAEVVPEVVGRRVIGDEQVDQAIFVDVGGDDAEAATVGVDDTGLGRHVDKPAAIVPEEMIGA